MSTSNQNIKELREINTSLTSALANTNVTIQDVAFTTTQTDSMEVVQNTRNTNPLWSANRNRVMAPKIVYKGLFDIDRRDDKWSYTITNGGSATHIPASKRVDLVTVANTAGKITMESLERINCFDVNTMVFFKINTTTNSGGSSGDSVQIGNLLISWANINVIVFDFNNGHVRWGGIDSDGKLKYSHESFGSDTQATPLLPTNWHLPLRIEVNTSATSPIWTTSVYSCKVIQENIERPLTNIKSASISTTFSNASLSVAMVGIRYDTAKTGAHFRPVSVLSFDYSPDGTNEAWLLKLVLNPTIAGGGGTWNTITNSAVEALDGVVANTVTGGTDLYCVSASNLGGSGHDIVNLPRSVSLREGDEIVVVVQALTTQAGRSIINWVEG